MVMRTFVPLPLFLPLDSKQTHIFITLATHRIIALGLGLSRHRIITYLEHFQHYLPTVYSRILAEYLRQRNLNLDYNIQQQYYISKLQASKKIKNAASHPRHAPGLRRSLHLHMNIMSPLQYALPTHPHAISKGETPSTPPPEGTKKNMPRKHMFLLIDTATATISTYPCHGSHDDLYPSDTSYCTLSMCPVGRPSKPSRNKLP